VEEETELTREMEKELHPHQDFRERGHSLREVQRAVARILLEREREYTA